MTHEWPWAQDSTSSTFPSRRTTILKDPPNLSTLDSTERKILLQLAQSLPPWCIFEDRNRPSQFTHTDDWGRDRNDCEGTCYSMDRTRGGNPAWLCNCSSRTGSDSMRSSPWRSPLRSPSSSSDSDREPAWTWDWWLDSLATWWHPCKSGGCGSWWCGSGGCTWWCSWAKKPPLDFWETDAVESNLSRPWTEGSKLLWLKSDCSSKSTCSCSRGCCSRTTLWAR